MMRHIDFEAKSDRELLILLAQKTNEMVDHFGKLNDTVAKHERRITTLEAKRAVNCEASKVEKFKVNWQIMLGIIALLSAAAYAIGDAIGWW